jgi:Prophage CP4-57 regulatory protein (AlpA)
MQPSVWESPVITEWLRGQQVAAGRDPSLVKEEGFRYLRLPDVRRLTSLSKTSIYRRIAAGSFPRPMKLS